MTREEVIKYIDEKCNAQLEKMWQKYPNYVVFRHQRNRKWFGLLMDVSTENLGLAGDAVIDVLDVKLPPETVAEMVNEPGYLPAYHMNKTHWITVRLDQVNAAEVEKLLAVSYELTK